MDIHPSVARQMVLEAVSAKRRLQRSVRERARSRLCLIEGCQDKAKQRGLCVKHVQQFYQRRRACNSKKSQAEFESQCIRDGLILPPGKQRQLSADDPFSKVKLSAG